MKAVAIIPAAGVGTRMRTTSPKQFLSLAGVPILVHTLRKFSRCPSVGMAIVPMRKSDIASFEPVLEKEGLLGFARLVPGGIHRQDSVYSGFQEVDPHSPIFVNDCLVLAASKLAKQVNAKAIVGMSSSGYSGYKSSSHRPNANIFIFTSNKSILNTMSLVWATRAYFYEKQTSTDETIADVQAILKRDGHVKAGDIFITLASMPIHERNRTNMMKVNVVD